MVVAAALLAGCTKHSLTVGAGVMAIPVGATLFVNSIDQRDTAGDARAALGAALYVGGLLVLGAIGYLEQQQAARR